MLTKEDIQEFREIYNKAECTHNQFFSDSFIRLLEHAEEMQERMEQISLAFTTLKDVNEARNKVMAELMDEIAKYNTGETSDVEELVSIFYKLAETGKEI